MHHSTGQRGRSKAKPATVSVPRKAPQHKRGRDSRDDQDGSRGTGNSTETPMVINSDDDLRPSTSTAKPGASLHVMQTHLLIDHAHSPCSDEASDQANKEGAPG